MRCPRPASLVERCWVLLPILLGLPGCGDIDEAAGERTSDEAGTRDLADLTAIGYGAFDAQAEGEGGARIFDDQEVAAGWNLFADEESALLLVDRHGVERRRIEVPGRTKVEHGEPVAAGYLTISVDEGWDLIDEEGEHTWALVGNAHHDVAERPAGGYYALAWEEREYLGRRVRFDHLMVLATDGTEVRELWSSFDARQDLREHHPALALDTPVPESSAVAASTVVYDYHHINTVQVLGDAAERMGDARFRAGYLLLCARNASLVFVLNPESGAITWSFGPRQLDYPHTPSLTPSGKLLIFDNGWHRGWSRAIEVDPRSSEILWSFEASPRESFFTQTRGSAQRLANGNTLLCEGEAGRALEVTTDGRVVWSFQNRLLSGRNSNSSPRRRRIYRFTRVPALD
ncbi:MAG: hypothetical protein ACI8PQ_000389 [Planctomycetota bacterium]